MKARSNLLRRAGLACLGLGAAATALAFVLDLNPNTGLPKKWPAGPIPFRVMLGDTSNLTDGSSFNTSFEAAAKMWNAVTGSAQFQLTFSPPAGVAEQNDVNEVVFASTLYGHTFPAGVAGVTARGVVNNVVMETDITFNTAFAWDSYRGFPRPTVDLQRVALHELGHALGLIHPDQAGQIVTSIMNSRAGDMEFLGADDLSGAQSLYGPPGVPANDAFASATLFVLANDGVGPTTLKGFNTNASKEAGEPSHAIASSPGQTLNKGGRSVWWRWKAPAAGSMTVDTGGSYFDTALAVYTGSSVPALTAIASNDDVQAGVIQTSSVSFNVTSGTTYSIAVDGFNADDSHGADSGGVKINFLLNSSDLTAPAITTHPASQLVTSGSNVTFSVIASGGSPLSYQWLFNSSPIANATAASFSLTAVTSSQGGIYSVTVSNPAGTVTSNGATLSVSAATPTPPPPSGGGGGGGGGAPSLWFCTGLLMFGLARCFGRRK